MGNAIQFISCDLRPKQNETQVHQGYSGNQNVNVMQEYSVTQN